MIETMIGSVKKQEEDAQSKAHKGFKMKTVRPELEHNMHGTDHETDPNIFGGRKPRKLKKKRKKRQKRPQSAAGVRSRQTQCHLPILQSLTEPARRQNLASRVSTTHASKAELGTILDYKKTQKRENLVSGL